MSRTIHFLLTTAICALASAPAVAQSLEDAPADTLGLRGAAMPRAGLAPTPGGLPPAYGSGGGQLTPNPAIPPVDANAVVAPPATYSAGSAPAGASDVTNYGKPRKRQTRPLPNPSVKVNRQPLPQLEPYPTSYAARRRAQAARRGETPDPQRPDWRPPTGVAEAPLLPAPRRTKVDENPYEPTGLDVIGLRLKPYAEVDTGYDSNPNRVQHPAKGAAFLRAEGGAAFQSDWNNHALSGDLRGGYTDYFGVSAANRPDGKGSIAGRIDVTRDTKIDVGGQFSIDTIRQGSPELQPGSSTAVSTNRPVTWTAGAYLGVTQKFNRLEASLRGGYDRTETGDAHFSDGTTQLLSMDNYSTLSLRPRLSYEITPGFKPFVEATLDRRLYDNTRDINGFDRDSRGLAVRAGTTFEINRQLTGEIAAGYIDRKFNDSRLVSVRGPTVDGSLVWQASPLTRLTLKGSTTQAETNIANASGAIVRSVSGEITHDLMRNVTLTGFGGYQNTHYQGYNPAASAGNFASLDQDLITAGAKIDYHLTRAFLVRASYAYERLHSPTPGIDYTANVFLLGLRLQR
ncbi:MAG: outer membrane beta-barrel protein [Hyphomicrobiales bacterium]|nr:outer membrane beta-barrel protein [Hyphomicrobiales bacterium]